jgi:hypothetical protein
MAPLLTLLATVNYPTGPRNSNGTVPAEIVEASRSRIPNGKEPLGEYVVVNTPLWENNTLLIVLAVIGICLLIALTVLICMKLSERRRHNDIGRRMQMENDYMRSSLFDAASDITRASALHNLQDQRRR